MPLGVEGGRVDRSRPLPCVHAVDQRLERGDRLNRRDSM